jgi:hypothetical protein
VALEVDDPYPKFCYSRCVETSRQDLEGKDLAVNEVKLEPLKDGACIQMLHMGSFEQEWEIISQMIDFTQKHECKSHGHHHEIYISNSRHVLPERLKTVLRMPVRRLI